MDLFDFPYHKVKTKYPDRGLRVQLGGGWDYTAKPHTPPTREFILTFPVLKYFPVGEVTTGKDAQIDLGKLEAFYLEHELHKSFLYNHPIYGNTVVKFKVPIEIPEGETSGDGMVKGVSITLLEVVTT